MSNQLDTRDLQERLEELEDLKSTYDSAVEAFTEAEKALEDYARNREETEDPSPEQVKLEAEVEECESAKDDAEMPQEDIDELTELEELKEEVGSEWKYGVQLIPVDDFVEYCQELCDDIGDLPKDLPSYIVIDWDATANNIKQDYSETHFQGEDYLYRP